MLSVKNLVKVYQSKKQENKVVALNNVSIDFPDTGLVFLLGKSGSGKSTLLNAIGGLDGFDSGEIIIKGKSSKDFSQSDFDSYRNTFIGFIFQEYNILENFTVQKNLALAIELQGKKAEKSEVEKLLRQVDMLEYAKRKPNELSGGQKQRVAIARALIKNPEIIMADEPTGALDSNTGKQVMETLKELSKTKLVIIVSHDRDFAENYGDRIIELKDGQIIRDVTKKEIEAEKTASGVSIVDKKYIHIKKGQRLTDSDIKEIAKQIILNSKENDTIISLDDKANTAVKKAENIADSGNQEAFLETQKEDIKTKEYSGKDLKLIKSRLKFSDSFKMGASSLKSKVSKLVFTTILAVFAFTLFGVVDAFSCWSRANSTWQAIESSNTTTIAGVKTVLDDDSGYGSTKQSLSNDIESLEAKFPDYIFKGVVTSGYSNSFYVYLKDNVNQSADEIVSSSNSLQLYDSNNKFYSTDYSGFISVTESELDSWNFSLIGRLPTADNEICLAKHLFESLKKANESITDSNYSNLVLRIYINSSYKNYEVVGIVDDGTDLSKYENMSDAEISENYYNINQILNYGFTNLIYLYDDEYQRIYDAGNNNTYYYLTYNNGDEIQSISSIQKGTFTTSEDVSNYEKEEYERNLNYGYTYQGCLDYYEYDEAGAISDFGEGFVPTQYSFEGFIQSKLTYYKGGDTSAFAGLKNNEIIVYSWMLSEIEDYESKIDSGLVIQMAQNYNGQNVITEFVVVGTADGYCFIDDEYYAENVVDYFKSYSYILTKLNGSSTDESLVKTFETYNSDGVRYTIQYEATSTLEMFESMLSIMTSIFVWVAVALAVFAGLLLINFISTSISYKKREIGVLRALGARGSDVFGIFFNESMVIAFINFVISAVLTFVACTIVNQIFISEMGMTIYLLSFSIRQVLLILAVSVLVAFLASLIPVSKISRKKPIDAINNR